MMTTLRLTVISAPSGSPLNGQNIDISVTGSSLGRGGANEIVLPDQERIVSTRHASIRHDLGQFVITDHSTNGTFLNDSTTPLGPEKSVALQNGDVVAIGKYRLQVKLVGAAVAAAPSAPAFLDQLTPAPARPAPAPAPAPAVPDSNELDDFDKWLEPQSAPSQPQPLWGISNVEHAVSDGFDDINDPLAAIEKAQQNEQGLDSLMGGLGGSDSLDDDPDWWKGSQKDDISPLQQAFEAPKPVTPNPQPMAPPAPPANGFASEATPVPLVDDAGNLDALLGLDSDPSPDTFNSEATPVPPFLQEAPHSLQEETAHFQEEPPTAAAITPEKTSPPPFVPPQPPKPVAPPAPVASPAGAASPGAPGDTGALLAQLLELGQLTPEQLQSLPEEMTGVLRETIARLVEMLRARSSIKNELRLDRTMIQPVENNPLKFALTERDALRYLFGERSGAYMSGRRAVEEAFADIEQHQVALLAGMRSAYEKMLEKFSPEALEQRFGESLQVGLLGNKKSRLWDAYGEYFDKLRQDPEASFTRLFGNEFANAYEEQVNTIKSTRRDPSRSR